MMFDPPSRLAEGSARSRSLRPGFAGRVAAVVRPAVGIQVISRQSSLSVRDEVSWIPGRAELIVRLLLCERIQVEAPEANHV